MLAGCHAGLMPRRTAGTGHRNPTDIDTADQNLQVQEAHTTLWIAVVCKSEIRGLLGL